MQEQVPAELFPVGTEYDEEGRLLIGGCDVMALATSHGTPLYLYDQATMDAAVEAYRAALAASWPGRAEVAYAAKAWLTLAVAQWAAARGLGMDVVSEGELRHALQAAFPPARIHAHGNNKSDAFLQACVAQGVGRIVLDHEREVERLAAICTSLGRRQGVWLRINPATAARTHASIETGSATSKFGLGLQDGSALRVARYVLATDSLDLLGVHFHIGSQFSDTVPLREATRRLFDWLATLHEATGWAPKEFSPGGGWAVPYVPGAPHLLPARAVEELARTILSELDRLGMALPRLILEPGRELVARAGVALYRVGALKEAGGVQYAFIDGGLADNPRPALYDAEYWALRVGGDPSSATRRYALAGPFCESGDVLIREIPLPELREGDLIAVPASGAYQLSMASTYNGTPRPAVLWLEGGKARLVQQRERIEALWARELPLDEG